jgi:hypothetical protein
VKRKFCVRHTKSPEIENQQFLFSFFSTLKILPSYAYEASKKVIFLLVSIMHVDIEISQTFDSDVHFSFIIL